MVKLIECDFNSMVDYPKEQLWELYKNIPEDLQEAVVSKKTAETIYQSCLRHGLKDKKKIREIIKHACYVLFGIIPPNELSQTLEKEIKLTKAEAKDVSEEISRFIFSPLENSLGALYNIEIVSPKKTAQPSTLEKNKSDKYREPIK